VCNFCLWRPVLFLAAGIEHQVTPVSLDILQVIQIDIVWTGLQDALNG